MFGAKILQLNRFINKCPVVTSRLCRLENDVVLKSRLVNDVAVENVSHLINLELLTPTLFNKNCSSVAYNDICVQIVKEITEVAHIESAYSCRTRSPQAVIPRRAHRGAWPRSNFLKRLRRRLKTGK